MILLLQFIGVGAAFTIGALFIFSAFAKVTRGYTSLAIFLTAMFGVVGAALGLFQLITYGWWF